MHETASSCPFHKLTREVNPESLAEKKLQFELWEPILCALWKRVQTLHHQKSGIVVFDEQGVDSSIGYNVQKALTYKIRPHTQKEIKALFKKDRDAYKNGSRISSHPLDEKDVHRKIYRQTGWRDSVNQLNHIVTTSIAAQAWDLMREIRYDNHGGLKKNLLSLHTSLLNHRDVLNQDAAACIPELVLAQGLGSGISSLFSGFILGWYNWTFPECRECTIEDLIKASTESYKELISVGFYPIEAFIWGDVQDASAPQSTLDNGLNVSVDSNGSIRARFPHELYTPEKLQERWDRKRALLGQNLPKLKSKLPLEYPGHDQPALPCPSFTSAVEGNSDRLHTTFVKELHHYINAAAVKYLGPVIPSNTEPHPLSGETFGSFLSGPYNGAIW